MCENCKRVKLINDKLHKYVQFEVDISNYIGYIELFNTFDLQFGLLSVANLWGYHSENHIVKALISECGGWGAQSVR